MKITEKSLSEVDTSIFVGSRGLDDLGKQSGLGSVSMGLVTNAPCSVEIVR